MEEREVSVVVVRIPSVNRAEKRKTILPLADVQEYYIAWY